MAIFRGEATAKRMTMTEPSKSLGNRVTQRKARKQKKRELAKKPSQTAWNPAYA